MIYSHTFKVIRYTRLLGKGGVGEGHVIMTIEMTIQLVTADDESNKTKDKKRMVEM